MALSNEDIRNHLESTLGIERSYKLQYANEYSANPYPFYLKSANKNPIVIHPDAEERFRRQPIDGVRLDGRYFSSALRGFPRLEDGVEPHGYAIEVDTIAALNAVLLRIGAISASTDFSPELQDIESLSTSSNGTSETERATLIAARLGQGLFRLCLMKSWDGRCAVTGVDVAELVRASHIKPWRSSSNIERLDPDNGLLLIANLDAAFDVGLISFEDDGVMLFSPRLGSAPHEVLGIGPNARLSRQPSARQQYFLGHHRTAAKLP